MSERRAAKVSIGKSGGTAKGNAKTHRIILPNKWAKEMGISEDQKLVDMDFDGTQVIIRKKEPHSKA